MFLQKSLFFFFIFHSIYSLLCFVGTWMKTYWLSSCEQRWKKKEKRTELFYLNRLVHVFMLVYRSYYFWSLPRRHLKIIPFHTAFSESSCQLLYIDIGWKFLRFLSPVTIEASCPWIDPARKSNLLHVVML